MSSGKRIFQIAKELNISHIEIISFLTKKDKVKKYDIMTMIDGNLYQEILLEFSKDKEIVERQKKKKPDMTLKAK